MAGLAATGTLSYNGFVFDGASKSNVSVQFIYDDANRVITAHKHTIQVEAILANDATSNNADMDSDILNVRKRLGAAGKLLAFVSKGFGNDLLVGPGSQVKDIDNGPRPKVLQWLPIGDDKAVKITWVVETTIAVCETGQQRNTGYTAFNYSQTWAIDENADTTSTTTGYVEIAHWAGSRHRSADTIRRNINFSVPEGFTRTQSFTLSPDRRRMNFSITDREIPSQNPYPAGITKISASHRVTWTRQKVDGGQKYFNVLSANIMPEAHLSGNVAWVVFSQLYANRRKSAKENARNVMLEALHVEEDIYGRSHRFLARYSFLSSIGDFINDSGLWQPTGGDWGKWKMSLEDSVFDTRGSANLGYVNGRDIVISICGDSPKQQDTKEKKKGEENEGKAQPSAEDEFDNEIPPADKSYRKYNMQIEVIREQPTAKHQIIQKSIADSGFRLPNDLGDRRGNVYPAPSSVQPDTVQVSGTPTFRIILSGSAERLGHRIQRPALVKVGSADATEVRGSFKQRQVGVFFKVSLYSASWRIEYVLNKSPSKVPMPNSIMEQSFDAIVLPEDKN